MKQIYIKLNFMILLLLIITGCSSEQPKTLNDNLLEHFSIRPNIDFKVTYDLSKISLEDVISNTINELYSEDLTEDIQLRSGNSGQEESIAFVAVDFLVNENQVEVITTIGEDPVSAEVSDDLKCGGNAGDGWTSYGTCYNQECVETKSGEAVAELSDSLTPGKCLDIRVKRNSLNARVCGRVVSC